jgi:hypothetical protein
MGKQFDYFGQDSYMRIVKLFYDSLSKRIVGQFENAVFFGNSYLPQASVKEIEIDRPTGAELLDVI